MSFSKVYESKKSKFGHIIIGVSLVGEYTYRLIVRHSLAINEPHDADVFFNKFELAMLAEKMFKCCVCDKVFLMDDDYFDGDIKQVVIHGTDKVSNHNFGKIGISPKGKFLSISVFNGRARFNPDSATDWHQSGLSWVFSLSKETCLQIASDIARHLIQRKG